MGQNGSLSETSEESEGARKMWLNLASYVPVSPGETGRLKYLMMEYAMP